jgi:hypothetical protein
VYESFSPQLFGTNSSVAQTSGSVLFFVGPGSTSVQASPQVLTRPPLDQYSPCYPIPLWAQAGVQSFLPPPPPPPTVSITTANIETDEIVVSLAPSGLSGSLLVGALGAGINHTLFSGTRSSGSHTFSFNRPALPNGSYTSVSASWTEQNEAFCLGQSNAPPNASGRSFRPQAIVPNCGSAFTVNNLTVAKGDDAPLVCGDRVLIAGLGGSATIKTVTDRCPACTGQLQLDNYTTQTACQPGTILDLGNFKTIRLR